MLFYGLPIHEFVVPFLIVAEDNPILWTDNTEPFVVVGLVTEAVLGIVMPLDIKRRPSLLDCLRKALAKIPIEVKRQWTDARDFRPPSKPSNLSAFLTSGTPIPKSSAMSSSLSPA
jgi:hypothetical protein